MVVNLEKVDRGNYAVKVESLLSALKKMESLYNRRLQNFNGYNFETLGGFVKYLEEATWPMMIITPLQTEELSHLWRNRK